MSRWRVVPFRPASTAARRRVRGVAAQGVFITLLFVAANLRKIDAHQQQLANRDTIEA